ncbi:MAG: HAD-IA family hydrolase [Arenicella sp.]|nr:HAD-IA family hydrolase [Arenicella sp.]
MQLKALLLDLDGTLVDTAPDMVGTLNRLLAKHKRSLADPAVAGLLVSNGARALLQHGFGDDVSEAAMTALIEEFLDDYALHVCEQSKLYAGMDDALSLCRQNDIKWGVVTNKPLQLSRALLDELGILENCAILLGGDSLPVKKPDPAPLLHCCMVLNLAASECLYLGDHERDVQAGNAAGMDTAVALWGYINGTHQPENWNAQYLFNNPDGLIKLIGERTLS